jgi:hypothetical protein
MLGVAVGREMLDAAPVDCVRDIVSALVRFGLSKCVGAEGAGFRKAFVAEGLVSIDRVSRIESKVPRSLDRMGITKLGVALPYVESAVS